MNGVTVVEALVVAEQRQAALPAELAGSLVLSAADAVVLLSLRITPQDLVLLEDGTIRVSGGNPSDELSAEASLRELLEQLLLCASSVTPALLRASRRPSRGSIAEFIRELEVALIPTNRGAARRALARLSREVAFALEHSPTLKQAAELRACASARNASAEVPVVAPPPPVQLAPIEELEVELEMSPSLPAVPLTPAIAAAAPAPARPQPPLPRGLTSFEIPDLEIPGTTKAELAAPSDWQPVEHTVRLEVRARSVTSHRSVTSAAMSMHAPVGSSQAAALQLEYVELSDEDVHEATAELPLPPQKRRLLPPPKPPLRARRCPAPERSEAPLLAIEAPAAPERSEAPLLAIEAPADPESQTAEPFLLVVQALGQESLEQIEARADARSDSQLSVVLEDSVPLQTNQASESQCHEWTPEAIECESSEQVESYPLSLEFIDPNDLEESLDGWSQSADSMLELTPKFGKTEEPVAAESEHTALDVVTFATDAGASDDQQLPANVTDAGRVLSLEQAQPIVWRPQPIPDPAAILGALDWPEIDEVSEVFSPIIQNLDPEPEPVQIRPWEPHRYSAEPQTPMQDRVLEARIAAFAVREYEGSRELTRDLRSLAGLDEDIGPEIPLLAPQRVTCALDDSEQEESENPLVRTLIGMGAVGTPR